jgi:hypothetical protein
MTGVMAGSVVPIDDDIVLCDIASLPEVAEIPNLSLKRN